MKIIFTILFIGLIFSQSATAQARKTITNQDLERFRLERLKTDPDDETERRRLGLPSRAEQEQARQIERQKLGELAAKIRREQQEKEDYWAEQTLALRAEIAGVEAEINYLSTRVGELPAPRAYYSVGQLPYYGNCCFGGYSQTTVTSGIGGAAVFGRRPQITLSAGFGKTSVRQTGSVSVLPGGPVVRQTRFPVGGVSHRRGLSYGRGILIAPLVLPSYENFTRADLLERLRSLEQTRAGLLARFEFLADEARRDGVRID